MAKTKGDTKAEQKLVNASDVETKVSTTSKDNTSTTSRNSSKIEPSKTSNIADKLFAGIRDNSNKEIDVNVENVKAARLESLEKIKKLFNTDEEEEVDVKEPETENKEEPQDTEDVVDNQENSPEDQETVEKEKENEDKEVVDSEDKETKTNNEPENDPLKEIAKEEGIDDNLTKDFAVKKLLKSLNKANSQKKQLEARLEKQLKTNISPNEDLSIWTEEYARSAKDKAVSAIDNALELLERPVEHDDDGNELPIKINGHEFSRKDIRVFVKNTQEELGKIESKTRAHAEFERANNEWEAQATKDIPWFADDSNPIAQRAEELWTEALATGFQNVPHAKYIFARGFDAIVKDEAKNKPLSKQIKESTKKPEPKPTTKQVQAAAPSVKSSKSDEERLKDLEQKANTTGNRDDQLAAIRARQAKYIKQYIQ